MNNISILALAAAFAAVGAVRLQGEVSFTCEAGKTSGPYTVLDAIDGGTSLTNLLAAASNKTLVMRWDDQQDKYVYYSKLSGAWSVNAELKVGEGFWVWSPMPLTNRWTIGADPPQPPLALVSNHYYLRGAFVNAYATYEDVVGAPPQSETTLLRYVGDGVAVDPKGPPLWDVYSFSDGIWTPATPVLRPLEAAFIIYPTLRIKITPTNPPPLRVLTWPRGRLQSCEVIKGPWQDVTNAWPPYGVDPSTNPGGSRFYRALE
jgi:hypothetical protein